MKKTDVYDIWPFITKHLIRIISLPDGYYLSLIFLKRKSLPLCVATQRINYTRAAGVSSTMTMLTC